MKYALLGRYCFVAHYCRRGPHIPSGGSSCADRYTPVIVHMFAAYFVLMTHGLQAHLDNAH